MPARSIFIGGTASHAGKSWFATAICRVLRNRGMRVAPFKAQNMSNNSYPCANGGEIGRAQVAQAEACGLDPITDMNPILLKPHSECGSQVIVDGSVWRDLSARAYYDHFDFLAARAMAAYQRLASEYEVIVIEGAGSVAEVNLKSRDLVNFGFATRVQAPALIVADIDRGGVFGALVGTMQLLTHDERKLVRSFAVNRFRGDASLFQDGVSFLERQTNIPCIGVFPMAQDIRIDAEDAVSLEDEIGRDSPIAAVWLPHISNFTDFDRLNVRWIDGPSPRLYSHVILPGTKNTPGDLEWLRRRGLDTWIKRQYAAGAVIIGVCGGYQMLGESIDGQPGLGMLPVRTIMRKEKLVRRVRATTAFGASFEAYEIHMGETEVVGACEPFAYVDGMPEGARVERCIGTYLHGADFELATTPPVSKDKMYDRLAAWFESNADMDRFAEMYL